MGTGSTGFPNKVDRKTQNHAPLIEKKKKKINKIVSMKSQNVSIKRMSPASTLSVEEMCITYNVINCAVTCDMCAQ